MRITFNLLREMNERCIADGIHFVVVIIPTKETVFSDYFEHDKSLSQHKTIEALFRNEGLAREALFRFLNKANIRYTDTLPALKHSVDQELYVRTAVDMHPNRNGYRVIADAVYRSIKGMGVKN